MKLQHIVLGAMGLFSLAACSGGSGGGGGTSTSAGYMGAPKASCAGAACIPGGSLGLVLSDAERAGDIYTAFNSVFVPTVNSFMAEVYGGLTKANVQSCSDISIGYSGTVNGYGVSVTSASRTIPTGFVNSGSYSKRLYVTKGETPYAEIEIKCGADTAVSPHTIYVKFKKNGDIGEFVFEKSGNMIRVMGAGILASGGRMIAWFKTVDGNDFDMEVVSNVDGLTDHYVARGQKSANKYLIKESSRSEQCVDGNGSATTCGFTLNSSPTLAVTTSNNWATVNLGTFTITDP